MEPAEYAAVVALLVEAYAAEWGPDGWSEYRSEMERIAERARDALVFVAVQDDTVIGTVTVLPPSSPLRSIVDDDAAEVRLLAVLPSEQRNGVGRQLIGGAAGAARLAGLGSLVLQCDEDLASAHHLYRHLGFTRAESHDIEVDGGYRALGYTLRVLDS